MTDEQRILIEILGETDGLFAPVREYAMPRPSNVFTGRSEYPAAGVPWASGAKSNADRIRVEKLLAGLRESGAVIVFRPKGRTLGVKLSDAAEATARALVGLPDLAATVGAVRGIAGRVKRAPEVFQDVWVTEFDLIDPDKTKKHRFLDVEELFIPAITRGWIVANSDTHGRVFYRMTTRGWALVDGPEPAHVRAAETFELEATEVYDARVKAVIDRLGVEKPLKPNELGPPCCPVSYWNRPVGDFADAMPSR